MSLIAPALFAQAGPEPGPGLAAATEHRPLLEWTDREGNSFEGWLVGVNFDRHTLEFRGADGRNYGVATERLSFGSKIQLLTDSGLFQMRRELNWPEGSLMALLRIALVFIGLYLLVLTFATWVVALILVPVKEKVFGRTVLCMFLWLVVSMVISVTYRMIAYGGLARPPPDADPTLHRLDSFVINILPLFYFIGISALSFRIGLLRSVAFTALWLVISLAIIFGLGFFVLVFGTELVETTLDGYILKPLGLL